MLDNRVIKPLSFCLLLGLLGACSAAPRHTDTYVSGSGAVTVLESDQESCVRSCNADFDRCGDTKAASEQIGRGGQMNGVLGGAADCRDDMKSCLSRCKAR